MPKKNQTVAEGNGHREGSGVHTCKREQNWWHQPHATLIKTKKSINHKPNIKIKFRSHHWNSDNKNFEIRSRLTIFWQTFLFAFLITVIYSVIARTKRMKCQNKREQLSEQVYMSSRITNMVSEQMRTWVKHMLLL
jgi:ABC-type histidine transport system ATPase subunit